MATVTGYTAAKMDEIRDGTVVDGDIVGGDLVLRRYDGGTINAGSVVGPVGPTGPTGPANTVICTSSTRPTGGALAVGLIIYETDTLRSYVWTGSVWARLEHSRPVAHTWAVSGLTIVPIGANGYIPPMAVSVPSGASVKLRSIRYGIRAGTSVTFDFKRNGVTVTSLGARVAGVTRLSMLANDGTPVDLTDLDELAPVVTAISGTPDGFFVTAFMDVLG